jgi:hypothetical protein
MVNLAFPASMTIYYKPIGEMVVKPYTEAGNDLRSIIFPWLYFLLLAIYSGL